MPLLEEPISLKPARLGRGVDSHFSGGQRTVPAREGLGVGVCLSACAWQGQGRGKDWEWGDGG